MKKKLNIKDHLDGNSIDLSLEDLEEVPVKEIASIPKVTILDLSNNRITSIGKNFGTSLGHLVQLDLSKNQISSLPENFGLLVHLKQLDLYHNKLESLPLSFCHLRSLRWLDLKENPLTPSLAKVVGSCQDQPSCLQAAKNTVKHMTELNNIAEEENRLKQERKQKNEEKEQQLAQKKENKKKKKKKTNQKSVEPSKEPLNGQIAGSKEAEEIKEKPEATQKPFSLLSMGWKILRSMLNLILLTVILCGFTLFVLSILDEPTYAKVSSALGKNLKTVKLKIPKTLRIQAYNVYALFLSTATSIWLMLYRNMVELSGHLFKFYVFLTTDETVQLYLEAFKENVHILYIKTLDSFSVAYTKIIDYLNQK